MPLRTALYPLCCAVTLLGSANAADRIALAVPLEGPFALLGKQVAAGAQAAAKVLGKSLITVNDGCEPEAGPALASAIVAAKPDAAIGFLCLESLNGALPSLKESNIPALSIAARADALTLKKDKTGFLFSRIAPRDGMEAEALATYLLPLWRDKNFAIVDDGTIHARDLVESFRLAAAESGLKPVFSDTFRPGLDKQNALANRLRKAGATHVLFGGSIDDALILSRDAQSYGGLTLALGESALPSEPQTEHGPILALALPDLTLLPDSAAAKLAIAAEGVLPDAYALRAFAAVELTAADATGAGGSSGAFSTAAGTIAFTPAGDLAVNPFRLAELKNGSYVPVTANAEGQ
jgi:branched-chain amino acid transport system substrate-binding protein